MLTSNVVKKGRPRCRRWVWLAVACVLIAVGGIAIAGLKLVSQSTGQLVIAAVGVEESRRAFLPLALQRAIAKEVLRRRDKAAFEPALDDATIVLSLPLVIATMAHYPEDQSQTKSADRRHAMEVAEIMLGRGISVNKKDHFGCTTIQSIALERDSEFFEFLLELGADSDYKNPNAVAEICRHSANEIMSRDQ